MLILFFYPAYAETLHDINVTDALHTSDMLEISIVSDKPMPQEKLQILENVILSTKHYEVDNEQVFYGWLGALIKVQETLPEKTIPTRIIITHNNTASDVLLYLSESANEEHDGYTFYANLESGKIQPQITIYQSSDLESSELGLIVKHEFGHALGLGHSTLPMDIMNDIINEYSTISDCEVDALVHLYVGKTSDSVLCVENGF